MSRPLRRAQHVPRNNDRTTGGTREGAKMALMEWTESLSVGVPELDNDHKQLVAIINRIAEAEEKGGPADWVFSELERYTREHFRHEEGRLAEAGYEELAAHKKQHKAFIEWLETVKAAYHLDPSSHHYLARTVNDYLKRWWTHHILGTDMKYKGRIT
jgi:hemerythrin